MKLSTRSRYGTRLMLDMAENYDRGPIQLGTVAKRQGISIKYLEQIIIPLKKSRYILSSRGFKGGHVLAKPPEQITIGEIVALLEGGKTLTECVGNPETCERSMDCLTRMVWQEAAEAMYQRLNGITLADLLKRAGTGSNGASPPDPFTEEEPGPCQHQHRPREEGDS